MRLRVLLALALAVPLASPAAADGVEAESGARTIPFSVVVDVAADGSATAASPLGVTGKLAGIVRDQLAALPYEPATRDGVPVPSTIMVDGDVVLVPDGDAFSIALEDLRSQPVLLDWRPAHFPRDPMRASRDGVVRLRLEVDADGRVVDAAVLEATPGFADEARAAARDWRFQPPVEGEGFQVGATFWFHGNWPGPPRPEPACDLPPQGAHLAGGDGCMRISETTGTRVARGARVEPVRREFRDLLPSGGGR